MGHGQSHKIHELSAYACSGRQGQRPLHIGTAHLGVQEDVEDRVVVGGECRERKAQGDFVEVGVMVVLVGVVVLLVIVLLVIVLLVMVVLVMMVLVMVLLVMVLLVMGISVRVGTRVPC